MKKYRVYRSDTFNKELSKLDKNIADRADKIEEKLSENPDYGNPLGYRWFRETRYEKYRFYYIVYYDLGAIYMVAISDKKDQQKVINTIKLFFDLFKEEVINIINRNKDFT